MRTRRVRAVWIGGMLGLLAACTAQRTPPPSTDIDETGFRDDVRVLASDDLEGRRPGTPGAEKTVAFIVGQFRRLGLKPVSGDSYLQQVPLVEIQAGSDASLSVSGRGAVRRLAYAKDMVIWAHAQPEATLTQTELVFAGYGIVAPEYGWDDYANVDVHGKTVMLLVNDPGYGSQDPRVFKGNAATRYGQPSYKWEEAARHGAAGVLLIHDAAALGYGWTALVNERTGPQLELAAPAAAPAAIEGWISGDAARGLFVQAGVDFPALTAAAARPGFKPVALGLTVSAVVHDSVRRFDSPNIIGILPGGQRKREYVVYTAHWDHLGRQSAAAGGAILNGAVDASGVAGLLMLAQSFSRTRPVADRSIAFIAFTAESAGLLGSAYYVQNPLLSLRETVGVLSLDLLHIGGPTRDVMVFAPGNSELEEYLRAGALLQGREVHTEPHPEQGWYYRSDQFSFASGGVPALLAKAGMDDSARGPEWGRARLDDYMAHRYHQPSDQYSPDWDVRGTLDDLRLYYEVGNRLARTRRFPRWYPNSEFRASHSEAPDAP